MLKRVGDVFREFGQGVDRFGCRIQGNLAYREQLPRHRRLAPLGVKVPVVAAETFVAPNATLVGDVELGSKSTVWYGSVIRGDVAGVKIGELSSIGDRAVVHIGSRLPDAKPTTIGSRVVIETGAMLHGCTLEDECHVGAGAIVSEGAIVQTHSMVAPRAVVSENAVVKAGELWAGNPAQCHRKLTDEEKAVIAKQASELHELATHHERENRVNYNDLAARKAFISTDAAQQEHEANW